MKVWGCFYMKEFNIVEQVEKAATAQSSIALLNYSTTLSERSCSLSEEWAGNAFHLMKAFAYFFCYAIQCKVFASRESIEDRKRVLSVCYLPFSGSQTPALSLAWGICLRTVMGTSPSGCSSLPPPLLLVELELCSLIKHISELPPISSKISTCWPLWTVISREPGVATWSATTHVVSMELCQHKNFKTWANLF